MAISKLRIEKLFEKVANVDLTGNLAAINNTRFGSSDTDIHQFTGSVQGTGSFVFTGSINTSGSTSFGSGSTDLHEFTGTVSTSASYVYQSSSVDTMHRVVYGIPGGGTGKGGYLFATGGVGSPIQDVWGMGNLSRNYYRVLGAAYDKFNGALALQQYADQYGNVLNATTGYGRIVITDSGNVGIGQDVYTQANESLLRVDTGTKTVHDVGLAVYGPHPGSQTGDLNALFVSGSQKPIGTKNSFLINATCVGTQADPLFYVSSSGESMFSAGGGGTTYGVKITGPDYKGTDEQTSNNLNALFVSGSRTAQGGQSSYLFNATCTATQAGPLFVVSSSGEATFSAGLASGYPLQVTNDGDDANRYGIQIQAGADDASGQTFYINCNDGDGGNVGYIENNGGTFRLVDPSDKRLKKNIKDTKLKGLETVGKIKVRDFELKKNNISKTGFIAQELEKAYPPGVSTPPDGELDPNGNPRMMGVSYEALVPVLIKAVQELSDEVRELKKKLNNG